MSSLTIREGNSGLLYVKKEDNSSEMYIPDYDLDRPVELLKRFYTVKSPRGEFIKDTFKEGAINWFPTTVSFLCWSCFNPYVKYERFLSSYDPEKYEYRFENYRRFYGLISTLRGQSGYSVRKGIEECLSKLLLSIHNRRTLKHNQGCDTLFFHYGLNDFRTVGIRKAMDELGVSYLEVGGMGKKEFLRNLVRLRPRPLFARKSFAVKVTPAEYELPYDLSKWERRLYLAAIRKVHELIAGFKEEYQFCKKELRNSPIRKLYGIDDTNFVYPLLYACRDLGIETIGHQHGICYTPYQTSYLMEGFNEGEYQWFDRVLVWGQYWKDFIERKATCYPFNFFHIGGNKDAYIPKSESVCGPQGTKNILIPYEFLANTYLIGHYICALQELGYTIYFKPRPDEKIGDQLECYCLSDERKRAVIVVQEITDELMSKIDIVAGTQTALIYDLFPYKKETWIFETEYKMLEHLVEQGVAKKIRLEHLEEDINCPVARGIDQEVVDGFFSHEPLKNVLERELL